MADINVRDRFGLLRRMREIRTSVYAPEAAITETAGPGFSLHFDTDNSLQVAVRNNVFRIESTGAFDPALWSTAHVGSGGATHTAGELVVSTGATANSVGKITSNQSTRQMSGTSQKYICVVRLDSLATPNNIRRWGLYDDQNGFFYQYDLTGLSIGYRNAGVDTLVHSSSFNGPALSGLVLDVSRMNQYDILFGGLSGRWIINGKNAHAFGTNLLLAPLTQVLTLPFRQESINSSGQTVNCRIFSRGHSFHRIGPSDVTPRYRNISSATTTVVKAGAGTLNSLVVNNAIPGGSITMYDNTAASGAVIGTVSIPGSTNSPFDLMYGLEFVNGLTVVTSAAVNLTVTFA